MKPFQPQSPQVGLSKHHGCHVFNGCNPGPQRGNPEGFAAGVAGVAGAGAGAGLAKGTEPWRQGLNVQPLDSLGEHHIGVHPGNTVNNIWGPLS